MLNKKYPLDHKASPANMSFKISNVETSRFAPILWLPLSLQCFGDQRGSVCVSLVVRKAIKHTQKPLFPLLKLRVLV